MQGYKVFCMVTLMSLILFLAGCGSSSSSVNTASQHIAVWKNASSVVNSAGNPVGNPNVGGDGSGNVFSVWTQSTGLYASRYNTASGWSTPQKIADPLTNGFSNIHFAVSKTGDAIVSWLTQEPGNFEVEAVRYVAGSGWQPVEHLGNIGSAVQVDNSTSGSIDLALACDTAGNFYAVWTQDQGSRNIYFSRYISGSGWQVPQLIGTGGTASYPQVAADSAGDIFVTWQQYDPNSAYPGDANVYSNHFKVSSGWGTQQQLKNVLGNADPPEVVVDSYGNATIIWSQSTASAESGIFYSRFE